MSFGNRNDFHQLGEGSNASAGDDDDWFDFSIREKQILFVIGIVVLGFCVWFAIAGSTSSNYVGKFRDIIPDVSKDMSRLDLKLMRACLPSRLKSDLDMIGHFRIPKTTKYLECSMRNYRDRFCSHQHRQHLVRQLKVYVAGIKSHAMRYEIVAESAIGARLIEKMRLNEFDDDITTREGPSRKIPEAIGIAFKDLMRTGYITKRDFGIFGWGFPEELEPYLAPPEREADCNG